jgi:hypothetical protein
MTPAPSWSHTETSPQEDHGDAVRRPRSALTLMLVAATVLATGSLTAALLATRGGHAPSALATVTGALAKTSTYSYSFDLQTIVPSYGGVVPPDAVSGAFDPGSRLGTELLTTRSDKQPVTMQIRFIGKYVYTSQPSGSGHGTAADSWDKSPIPPATENVLPAYETYGFVTDRPVSPAELSRVLQSAGTVREEGAASGPGWTGTRFGFTARFSGGRESISGTVYVDQEELVRRLVTITTGGGVTTDRVLTFTSFGAPLYVAAPPASQVRYTSTPSWGFYF